MELHSLEPGKTILLAKNTVTIGPATGSKTGTPLPQHEAAADAVAPPANVAAAVESSGAGQLAGHSEVVDLDMAVAVVGGRPLESPVTGIEVSSIRTPGGGKASNAHGGDHAHRLQTPNSMGSWDVAQSPLSLSMADAEDILPEPLGDESSTDNVGIAEGDGRTQEAGAEVSSASPDGDIGNVGRDLEREGSTAEADHLEDQDRKGVASDGGGSGVASPAPTNAPSVRSHSIPKGYEGYDLEEPSAPDVEEAKRSNDGEVPEAADMGSSPAAIDAPPPPQPEPDLEPGVAVMPPPSDIKPPSAPSPSPPQHLQTTSKGSKVDNRIFFVIGGGAISLQVARELPREEAPPTLLPSDAVDSKSDNTGSPRTPEDPSSATVPAAPASPFGAPEAPEAPTIPTTDPELLQTLSLGESFSGDSVLKILTERETTRPVTAESGNGNSNAMVAGAYVQQLSCTVLTAVPKVPEGSEGGESGLFLSEGGVVEMLCISQPLYDMAVRGTGGKALDDEGALKKALYRCSWWRLCDPAAFAKHVKGKCSSQEFTQVWNIMRRPELSAFTSLKCV